MFRPPRPPDQRLRSCLLCLAGALATTACELTEVEVAGLEPVVVVEAFLQLTLPPPEGDEARDAGAGTLLVLLHRAGPGADEPLDGASATIRAPRNRVGLSGAPVESCMSGITGGYEPAEGATLCFRLELPVGLVHPGEEVAIDVILADGRQLAGTTRVPGAFHIIRPDVSGECWLPPDRTVDLVWSTSERAWAYGSEASFENLREAFAPRGVVPPADRLVLQGVSVSAADTTMRFPTHFGFFRRLGSDARFLALLQGGLPAGVAANVAVTAVDGNHVRWLQGGDFNPSGRVRVPSVFEIGGAEGSGYATGVFGSSVRRMITVAVTEEGEDGKPCIASDP